MKQMLMIIVLVFLPNFWHGHSVTIKNPHYRTGGVVWIYPEANHRAREIAWGCALTARGPVDYWRKADGYGKILPDNCHYVRAYSKTAFFDIEIIERGYNARAAGLARVKQPITLKVEVTSSSCVVSWCLAFITGTWQRHPVYGMITGRGLYPGTWLTVSATINNAMLTKVKIVSR